MDSFLSLWEILQQFGPWAILILVSLLFVRILLDEDRASVIRGQMYRLAYAVSGRVQQEKKYIANDVRGRVNLARRQMQAGKILLPQAVDIAWVEGGKGTTQLVTDGEFIIRLDPSNQQEKNIALLTTAVVARTTLLGIRHYVSPELQSAIDLNLARKLLEEIGNRFALDWFLSNEYEPLLKEQKVKDRSDQVVTIDEKGLFTRMLLVELEEFAKRTRGFPPRPHMIGEIEGLVDFIYKIASRQAKEEVPLSYEKAHIRVGVIMVAKMAKILASVEPYRMAMEIHAVREVNSVYVLVMDKGWLGETDPRAEEQYKQRLVELEEQLDKLTPAVKDFELSYTTVDGAGNRRRARCIRYLMPQTRVGDSAG